MKVSDVLQCSFDSWYGQFCSSTIESFVIPIPADVLEYLLADGIFVGGDHGDEMESAACSNSASAGVSPDCTSLSALFRDQVNQAIGEIGGEVFAKLNWSSPKDAAWITPYHSLKCSNVDEVFLLLKSSDFIVHDLTEPFLECEDAASNVPLVRYVLVLRRWMDMHKCNEFRCFVKDGDLIAISQRHTDSYFPALSENTNYQQQLTKIVSSFFQNSIKSKFPLRSYAFDAYVDGEKVLLVDFNPWGIVTDSLLFAWTDLNSMGVQAALKGDEGSATTARKLPDLRLVMDKTIRSSDPFAGLHGVPLEYHRLALDAEEGKPPLDSLLDLMQAQTLSDEDGMEN